jgi:lipoyl-dependent peroxiredoxin
MSKAKQSGLQVWLGTKDLSLAPVLPWSPSSLRNTRLICQGNEAPAGSFDNTTQQKRFVMTITALYETSAHATGGRDGRVATLDGSLDLKLTTPKELGGPGGNGNNPEQLFAAGYAACFLNALKFTAIRAKASFPGNTAVTATVGIGRGDGGGFGLKVAMAVSLPGLDQTAAEALVEKAHETCPYSNATRNNIEVKVTINDVPFK